MKVYKRIIITLLFLGLVLFVFSNRFYQYNTIYNWINDNGYSTDDFNIEGVYFEKKVNDNGYFKRITVFATSVEEPEEEHLFVYSYSSEEKALFHVENIINENNMYDHYKMAVYEGDEIYPLLNGPVWILVGYVALTGFTVSFCYSVVRVMKKSEIRADNSI